MERPAPPVCVRAAVPASAYRLRPKESKRSHREEEGTAQVAPAGSADKRFLSASPVSHAACYLLRRQSPRLPGSRPTLNIKVFYVTLRLQCLSAARFIPLKKWTQFLALRRRSRQGRAGASLATGFVRLLCAFNPPFKAPRNGFDRFGTLFCRDPCALRRTFLTGRSCLYSPRGSVSRHHQPFTHPMGESLFYYPRHPGDHQPGKPRRSSPLASPSRPPSKGLPLPPSP